jgi:NADPH-dependent curcumin reductase CurA
MIASGEMKYREHVYDGLEHAGQAILNVLKGDNLGRPVIIMPNA